MKRLCIISIVWAAFCCFSPALSLACECAFKPEGVKGAFEQASLVFVGQVEKVKQSRTRPEELEVTFRVMKKLKGFEEIFTKNVLLYTPEGAKACRYSFLERMDYLVFAHGTPAHLQVNSCSRTKIVDNARDDMIALEKLAAQEAVAE